MLQLTVSGGTPQLRAVLLSRLLADLSSAGVNTQLQAGATASATPAPAWAAADALFQNLLVQAREPLVLVNSPAISTLAPVQTASTPATDLHAVVSQFWRERETLRNTTRFAWGFEDFWVFLSGYLSAALWSSTDDTEEPLDHNYELCNFGAESLRSACRDCFVFMASSPLEHCDVPLGQLGTDFWLTRCRHGSGFWDRDYATPAIRRSLTDSAHRQGERYVFVGDDGYLFISS